MQRLSRPDPHASASLGAVVFVHGAMGNMSVFYYTLANQVALAGYDVVLYVRRTATSSRIWWPISRRSWRASSRTGPCT